MATRERPLSPHLQTYRFMYTMALSISHRISGVALSFGFLVLAWWLVSLAIGPAYYDYVAHLLGTPVGLLALAGFVVAFWYHFCAGIRHLIFDTGRMLEKPDARRSAAFVVVGTLVLSLLSFWAVYELAVRNGGAA
jgi:succinate dehydrogenase / fumarate reductase cytochrome b subunit